MAEDTQQHPKRLGDAMWLKSHSRRIQREPKWLRSLRIFLIIFLVVFISIIICILISFRYKPSRGTCRTGVVSHRAVPPKTHKQNTRQLPESNKCPSSKTEVRSSPCLQVAQQCKQAPQCAVQWPLLSSGARRRSVAVAFLPSTPVRTLRGAAPFNVAETSWELLQAESMPASACVARMSWSAPRT